MSKLINELKAEHQTISDMLSKVRELGIGSKEAQQMLVSIKEMLLSHLAKEDIDLYPVLRRKAEADQGLNRTMDLFAKDMEAITANALEFFNKYACGGSDLNFAKEFGRLFVILSGRIRKEEDILYREYERIIS